MWRTATSRSAGREGGSVGVVAGAWHTADTASSGALSGVDDFCVRHETSGYEAIVRPSEAGDGVARLRRLEVERPKVSV